MFSCKEMNELISIVIPVHNSLEYLNECLSSVRNQTYEDLEIICVDDCSELSTAMALDLAAENDDRIVVIHLKQNAGAAGARNIGMKKSRGNYIMFLDSDDVFREDMVESLHNDISRYNADVCACGYLCFDSSTGKKLFDFSPGVEDVIDKSGFRMSSLGESGLTLLSTAPWNKMYRKGFLDESKISFQSLSSCNDVSFMYLALLKAARIVCCENKTPLINYRANTNVQISSNRKSENLFLAMKMIVDKLGDSISKLELTQIIYAYMSLAVYELQNCRDEQTNQRFYDSTRHFLETFNRDIIIQDPVINKRIELFLCRDYTSKWFNGGEEFYEQIRSNLEGLLKKISNNEGILIWGNGAKSKSLQRALSEKGFGNVCVTDKKNSDVGKYTEWGYLVIHSDDAIKSSKTIIASNEAIYNYLRDIGIECVNLEEYYKCY